jgi:hypothetical protein
MTDEAREPCQCHECTQARYRGSFQWQIDQASIPQATIDLADANREAPAHDYRCPTSAEWKAANEPRACLRHGMTCLGNTQECYFSPVPEAGKR